MTPTLTGLAACFATMIAPMLLAGTGGDLAKAYAAVQEALMDATHVSEVIPSAQALILTVGAIDNMKHSMPDAVSLPLKLRLRANANALSRSARLLTNDRDAMRTQRLRREQAALIDAMDDADAYDAARAAAARHTAQPAAAAAAAPAAQPARPATAAKQHAQPAAARQPAAAPQPAQPAAAAAAQPAQTAAAAQPATARPAAAAARPSQPAAAAATEAAPPKPTPQQTPTAEAANQSRPTPQQPTPQQPAHPGPTPQQWAASMLDVAAELQQEAGIMSPEARSLARRKIAVLREAAAELNAGKVFDKSDLLNATAINAAMAAAGNRPAT